MDDADQGWAFGDTYLFSATLVNQFRASVDRIGIHRYDDDYVSACDLGVIGVYCGYVPHQSGFTVTGAFSLGPGTGGQAVAHTTPLQMNDDISWVKGNHQINFGGGAVVGKMLFDGNVYSQTNWTFPNMASFLARAIQLELAFPAQQSEPEKVESWTLYIQDTWKVTPHFTVNAGLRWEPFLPPTNITGSIYNFSHGESGRGDQEHAIYQRASRPHLPGRSRLPGSYGREQLSGLLFAPRVAVAWDPEGRRQNGGPRFLGNRLRLQRR